MSHIDDGGVAYWTTVSYCNDQSAYVAGAHLVAKDQAEHIISMCLFNNIYYTDFAVLHCEVSRMYDSNPVYR